MTPLILAAEQPLMLPVSYGGIATATIGGVVVILMIAAYVLRSMQAARKALVDEVSNQLAVAAKPHSVNVQQPFTVQPHVEFTPIGDHRKLVEQVDRFSKSVDSRFVEMSTASSSSREKIYGLIREQGDKMRSEVKADLGDVHERINKVLEAVSELKGHIGK